MTSSLSLSRPVPLGGPRGFTWRRLAWRPESGAHQLAPMGWGSPQPRVGDASARDTGDTISQRSWQHLGHAIVVNAPGPACAFHHFSPPLRSLDCVWVKLPCGLLGHLRALATSFMPPARDLKTVSVPASSGCLNGTVRPFPRLMILAWSLVTLGAGANSPESPAATCFCWMFLTVMTCGSSLLGAPTPPSLWMPLPNGDGPVSFEDTKPAP